MKQRVIAKLLVCKYAELLTRVGKMRMSVAECATVYRSPSIEMFGPGGLASLSHGR